MITLQFDISRFFRDLLDLDDEKALILDHEIVPPYILYLEWKKYQGEADKDDKKFHSSDYESENVRAQYSQAVDRLTLKAESFRREHETKWERIRELGKTADAFQEHLEIALDYIGYELTQDEKKWDDLIFYVNFCKFFQDKASNNLIYQAHLRFKEVPCVKRRTSGDKKVTKAWKSEHKEEVREQNAFHAKKSRLKKASTQSEEEKLRLREAARLRKAKSRVRPASVPVEYANMI